ncbi:MAG: radical SAM protein [Methanosarcina sp.]
MVSPESTPNLHIFKFDGKVFAFDPVAVHLSALTSDETVFIRDDKKVQHEDFEKTQVSSEACPDTDRVEVMVNATQECNLTCRYCFVDRGRFGYNEERIRMLSTHLIRKLVEVLPEKFPHTHEFCIHFYGGEPLLNLPALLAVVEAAEGNPSFVFAITTNGTICNDDVLYVMRKGRFNIILSIDGPPDVHDEVRRTSSGMPTHASVMRFLQELRAQSVPYVRGSSVVRKGWSLREAREYLKTLPVDAIKAQAVRLPLGNELALDGKERLEYFEHLREAAAEVIECVRRGENPKDDRFNHRVLQLITGTRRKAFCGAGRWVFGMASDGTVLPCVLLAGKDGMDLGNIDDTDAKWVENGIKWADEHGPRSECKSCWALPLCGGGCPAMLSVCGEDECEMVRANCEMALAIYGSFLDRPQDLLVLGGY